MGRTAVVVNFGMVEWVKHGKLRYLHVMRLNEENYVRRVYEGRTEGGGCQEETTNEMGQ